MINTTALDEVIGRYRIKIRRNKRGYLWEVFEQGVGSPVVSNRSSTVENAHKKAKRDVAMLQNIDNDAAISAMLIEHSPNFGVHPDHYIQEPI